MDFYDSFHFLLKHPIFNNRFMEGLDLFVVKINPKTKHMDNDSTKNIKTEIWFEAGPYLYDESLGCKWSHDFDLDCGGYTFEEAIIKLAELVKKKYGRYKENKK